MYSIGGFDDFTFLSVLSNRQMFGISCPDCKVLSF